MSHLQFLVLGILLDGDRPGREIRRQLERFGLRRSGPAFYQLMSRLEEAGLVEGRYEQKTVEGQVVRERTYRLGAEGGRAWRECRDFHERVVAEFGTSRA